MCVQHTTRRLHACNHHSTPLLLKVYPATQEMMFLFGRLPAADCIDSAQSRSAAAKLVLIGQLPPDDVDVPTALMLVDMGPSLLRDELCKLWAINCSCRLRPGDLWVPHVKKWGVHRLGSRGGSGSHIQPTNSTHAVPPQCITCCRTITQQAVARLLHQARCTMEGACAVR